MAGIGFTILGTAVKAVAGDSDLLRPPVVGDEDDFNARCIKCYRCVSVCPMNAIRESSLTDGILAARTPKMDYHTGYCDFCNKCVEVCPTQAIRTADPLAPSTGRIGVAVIQTDRCIAYIGGTCKVCTDTCPYGAVELDEGDLPSVISELCNGCGVCEYDCPSSVYRSFEGGSRRGIVVLTNRDFRENEADAS